MHTFAGPPLASAQSFRRTRVTAISSMRLSETSTEPGVKSTNLGRSESCGFRFLLKQWGGGIGVETNVNSPGGTK